MVEIDRVRGADGGLVEIGVGEDDVRRLAAELERYALQVARARRLHDEVADLGRAGKRDLVDVGVRRDRGTGGLTQAGHDVDHAGWNADFGDELPETQRRERRLLGRLQHHRVAARERDAELPRRHQQREVPRDDLADDADGLAAGVAEHPLAGDRHRDRLALDLRRPPGVVAELVDHERDVGDARDRDRLAVVERLELRELLAVRLDEVGELPEHPAALRRRRARPGSALERLPRGADGAIDVLLVAGGNLRERLFRRGIVGRECLAGRRFHPLAVDQHPPRPSADELAHLGMHLRVRGLHAGLCHGRLSFRRPGTPPAPRPNAVR